MTARDPRPLAARLRVLLESLDTLSYYELFNVDPSATPEQIQAAFHAFSEQYHPDLFRGMSPALIENSRAIYRRGTEAYGTLRSKSRRDTYNLTLAKGQVRATAAPSSPRPASAQPLRKSLDDLCATPAGRLHARQADRAISDGDLKQAEVLLQRALRVEPNNPELRERYEAVHALRILQG